MSDRPTDRPTRQTDREVHREVSLPIISLTTPWISSSENLQIFKTPPRRESRTQFMGGPIFPVYMYYTFCLHFSSLFFLIFFHECLSHLWPLEIILCEIFIDQCVQRFYFRSAVLFCLACWSFLVENNLILMILQYSGWERARSEHPRPVEVEGVASRPPHWRRHASLTATLRKCQ